MISKNIILNTDSYKTSQWKQYPPKTTHVFSYIESRGGKWDQTVYFGLQAFLLEYLSNPITRENIEEAEMVLTPHGMPFNKEGWEYILDVHKGRLPLSIRSLPEGTVIDNKNVLLVIENTDPECFWLTSYIEPPLLRAIWYATTVATNSYESKKIIHKYLVESGDPSSLEFKLHDFGSRGVSSFESCGIGSAAHLVNFKGTDSISGLLFAQKYYGEDTAGFSIPAMEHSTVTTWGKEGEIDSYRNMLTQYAKPGSVLAAVSDSYDIYEACKMWGTELKQQIIDSGATLVVRPDSGDPATVVVKCLKILDTYFGHEVNEKGYKVLNNVRVIQGDGIDIDSIRHILFCVVDMSGYSADNIAFGQGGGLLQQVDRDTMNFAMKCSAAKIDGKWIDVYKDPVTDKGKRSKRGRLDLVMDKEGNFNTTKEDWEESALVEVFFNGEITNIDVFEDIRKRANKAFE